MPLIVVHQPARRGDTDLRVRLQLLDLPFDLRAAVDHGHTDILIVCEQPAQLVADLDGKLTRRGQDEALQVLALSVDMLDHRDAEGKGLARAGRRLGDDVFPL